MNDSQNDLINIPNSTISNSTMQNILESYSTLNNRRGILNKVNDFIIGNPQQYDKTSNLSNNTLRPRR